MTTGNGDEAVGAPDEPLTITAMSELAVRRMPGGMTQLSLTLSLDRGQPIIVVPAGKTLFEVWAPPAGGAVRVEAHTTNGLAVQTYANGDYGWVETDT